MTTLSDILKDKLEYTQFTDLNQLGKEKGFYYNDNFTGNDVRLLQSPLYSDNNSHAFSIILFHNNTTQPPTNTNMTTTPNKVELGEGEISKEVYDKLSDVEKPNYKAIYHDYGNSSVELLHYKLNPTNTNYAKSNWVGSNIAHTGGGGGQSASTRRRRAPEKTREGVAEVRIIYLLKITNDSCISHTILSVPAQ